MKDTLRDYGLAARSENIDDDRARAMLVKAHILICRDCELKPMAEMWLGIAIDRNWLTEEELDDCKHILAQS